MKALLIWNNLWADRLMSDLFIHSRGHLIYLSCMQKTVSSHCGLPIISYLSLHSLIALYSSCLSPSFLDSPPAFYLLSFSPFHQFFVSTVFVTSISLSLSLLPSHFNSIFPPLFTFSLQWGHSMNNSKVLQDDNGKLEVRLCVACVCVCVHVCVWEISWFIPARR